VLNAIEENPSTSTRAVAEDLNTSHSTVWRILKKFGYRPFKISRHQELRNTDYQRRLEFCNWILAQPDVENFSRCILFSDESNFSSDGSVNRHNCHYWSVDNPHWMREEQQQGRWSINVWLGIVGDHVIGPHFFEGKFPMRPLSITLSLRAVRWKQIIKNNRI